MLTYPDRTRFEQIRARWEGVQPAGSKLPRMLGRKEKTASRQPSNESDSSAASGGSKFRRKLSRTMSFISNPLSQRKPTTGQSQQNRHSLASTSNSKFVTATASDEEARLLASAHNSTFVTRSDGSSEQQSIPSGYMGNEKSLDLEATPKPLSRPRTMSFIPRPTRSSSQTSTAETTSQPPAFVPEIQARITPTKIPTPGPQEAGGRRSSPRNPFSTNTLQPPKQRTLVTPKLLQEVHAPSNNSKTQNKYLPKKPSVSLRLPQPTWKENKPAAKRDIGEFTQLQEIASRRESLPALKISTRRSFGPGNIHDQSKQINRATPHGAGNLAGTHLGPQVPLSAKRSNTNFQRALKPSNMHRNPHGNSIAQPRLLGPVNPPTPPAFNHTSRRPKLPRASTERDLHRKSSMTPSANSAGLPPRSFDESIEVRLPRSTASHNLLDYVEPPPPVPKIPERFKSQSHPIFPTNAFEDSSITLEPIVEQDTPASKLPLLTADSPRILSSPFVDPPEEQRKPRTVTEGTLYGTETPNEATLIALQPIQRLDPLLGNTSPMRGSSEDETLRAIPSLAPSNKNSSSFWNLHRVLQVEPNEQDRPKRPWSHTVQQYSANVDYVLQIKEPMPPLYWAGRFQSRFDQWRNNAMTAELDADFMPDGPLGRCTLSQDRLAVCYIFIQLRDLCASSQVADSLWEFEYRYRDDHKLLGTMMSDPVYLSHNHDQVRPAQALKQRAIGRAVRKLTPRKSSFVNLLKGKGWRIDGTSTSDNTVYDATLHPNQELAFKA